MMAHGQKPLLENCDLAVSSSPESCCLRYEHHVKKSDMCYPEFVKSQDKSRHRINSHPFHWI